MNNKYNISAYKMVVFQEAARLLREKYFPEEGESPELLCDAVFRAPREVPSDIIQQVIVALHRAEKAEELMMGRFKLEEMRDEEFKNFTEAAQATTKEVSANNAPARRPTGYAKKATGRAR